MSRTGLTPEAGHVALVDRQQPFARELAVKLGNDNTLTTIERRFAAAILRWFDHGFPATLPNAGAESRVGEDSFTPLP